MKIIFYDETSLLAYNPNTEKFLGIGGKETMIVKTAEALSKLGHEINIYINCNLPDLYDKVRYYHYTDYKNQETEVFISLGGNPPHQAKQFIYWSAHDVIKFVVNYNFADKIIVNGKWHYDFYKEKLDNKFHNKLRIVNPGVDFNLINPEIKKREFDISYLGHPEKGGMQILVSIFPKIKEKIEQTELHVYGGGGLWGWNNEQYRELYNRLIKSGIRYHGMVSKEDLLRYLSFSKILLYPVNQSYKETFGIAVLEAMACGCVPIVSDSGHLKYLVENGRGYLILGNPENIDWHEKAKELTIKLFTEVSLFEEKSSKVQEFAKKFTWENTAQNLLKAIKE